MISKYSFFMIAVCSWDFAILGYKTTSHPAKNNIYVVQHTHPLLSSACLCVAVVPIQQSCGWLYLEVEWLILTVGCSIFTVWGGKDLQPYNEWRVQNKVSCLQLLLQRETKKGKKLSQFNSRVYFILSLSLSLSLSPSSPLDRYQVVFLMPMVVSAMSSRVTGMRSSTWPLSRVGRERTRRLALSSSSGRRRCHSKSLDKRCMYSIITSSLDQ